MNRMRLLGRRKLLGVVGCGTIAIWSAVPRAALGSEDARGRMSEKLASLIHDPQRARQVGMVYLQSPLGQLAPPWVLVETVLAVMGPSAGSEAIRRYVVARIRRELQEMQVISVDDWIISPTEAQLCAVVVSL